MNESEIKSCSAFLGDRLIASGDLAAVAEASKAILDGDQQASILIFDDDTSELVEIDFRGTIEDVRRRLKRQVSGQEADAGQKKTRRGPGRPKLGVVSREVTLLPRHWEWLGSQPGGASVALRKLVEEARRVNRDRDNVRTGQEVAYRFMSAMAGDRPGFEEAARALFAGDADKFNAMVAPWSDDIRQQILKLAQPAFQPLK